MNTADNIMQSIRFAAKHIRSTVTFRRLVLACALAATGWLAIQSWQLLREHDPPSSAPPTIGVGFLPDHHNPANASRIKRLYVDIQFSGCDQPQKVSVLAFPESTGGGPGSVYFGASRIPSGDLTLTAPAVAGIEQLPYQPASLAKYPESIREHFADLVLMHGRVETSFGGGSITGRMEARWALPAGHRSCYLWLPSVITGDPVYSYLTDSIGRAEALISAPKVAEISLVGPRGGFLPGVIDLGSSGNPPRSTHNAEWTCESGSNIDYRPTTVREDMCAGWILIRENGSAQGPSLIFLYGTLLGVAISLVAELGLSEWRSRRETPRHHLT